MITLNGQDPPYTVSIQGGTYAARFAKLSPEELILNEFIVYTGILLLVTESGHIISFHLQKLWLCSIMCPRLKLASCVYEVLLRCYRHLDLHK